MSKPNRRIELAVARRDGGTVCGVDEVGYSPLAGPVVAAAVVMPGQRPRQLAALRDSKQLNAEQREDFDAVIRRVADVGVGFATVAEIDHLNIYQANLLAMARAVDGLDQLPTTALVDGRARPKIGCRVVTVVRGDEQCFSIAAASVAAKVWRDRLMHRLAEQYPGYGWRSNVGYGTEEHVLGLLRLGPTPEHRQSFTPIRQWLTDGVLGRGYRFAPVPALELQDIEILALRADLRAVFDRHRRHLGNLKKGAGWRLRAVGYRGGEPASGTGPLARWHGEQLATPDLANLMQVLDRRDTDVTGEPSADATEARAPLRP